MILHTTEVTPLPGYQLALRFNNGEAGEVDLSGELVGEIFAPLLEPALFATAHQHLTMKTVAWDNGAENQRFDLRHSLISGLAIAQDARELRDLCDPAAINFFLAQLKFMMDLRLSRL